MIEPMVDRLLMIERFRRAVDTVDALGITQEDLIVVNLHSYCLGCQVTDACFMRLAERLAVTEFMHYEPSPTHLRFMHGGIEFVAIVNGEIDSKYKLRVIKTTELCSI